MSDITLSRITPILSTIKLYVGSSSTKHMCQPQIIRHSLIYRGSGRWRGRAPSSGERLIISRNSQSQNVPLRLSNGLWRFLFCRILFRVLYRYSNQSDFFVESQVIKAGEYSRIKLYLEKNGMIVHILCNV